MQKIDIADQRHVVRPLLLAHPVEDETVLAQADRIAGVHLDVLFDFVGADQRHPDDESGHTEMCQMHAEEARRLVEQGRQPRPFTLGRLDPPRDVEKGGKDDPEGQQQTHPDQRAPGTEQQRRGKTEKGCQQQDVAQRTHQFRQGGGFPAGKGRDADHEQQRHHQRHEHGSEIRWADREFAQAKGVDQQRVERAEQHRAAGHHQQHVIGQQHGFAGEQGKASTQTDFRRAPGKQGERRADHHDQEGEDEDAATRIGREGMYRGQHPRAHQEGAQQ